MTSVQEDVRKELEVDILTARREYFEYCKMKKEMDIIRLKFSRLPPANLSSSSTMFSSISGIAESEGITTDSSSSATAEVPVLNNTYCKNEESASNAEVVEVSPLTEVQRSVPELSQLISLEQEGSSTSHTTEIPSDITEGVQNIKRSQTFIITMSRKVLESKHAIQTKIWKKGIDTIYIQTTIHRSEEDTALRVYTICNQSATASNLGGKPEMIKCTHFDLIQVFTASDLNKDGYLDLEELNIFLIKLEIPPVCFSAYEILKSMNAVDTMDKISCEQLLLYWDTYMVYTASGKETKVYGDKSLAVICTERVFCLYEDWEGYFSSAYQDNKVELSQTSSRGGNDGAQSNVSENEMERKNKLNITQSSSTSGSKFRKNSNRSKEFFKKFSSSVSNKKQ